MRVSVLKESIPVLAFFRSNGLRAGPFLQLEKRLDR